MGCCCFRRSALHPKKGTPLGVEEIEGQLFKNIGLFSLNELKAATNNFHLSNKIGRGGFGTVYKGTLKGGGQVAVKALSAESKQGVLEFLAEINLISSVKHPNLVALIGCCVDGTDRILVYEYLENKSLDWVLLRNNGDHGDHDPRYAWVLLEASCTYMKNLYHI